MIYAEVSLEKAEYVSETEFTVLYKRYTRKSVDEEFKFDSIYGYFLLGKAIKCQHEIHC